ncbi:MAG: putative rane protein [Betaproteobacteria bacterium]|jgi:hypothetical protein|nr:putative rane protein [Betaproteobacteria bacterium]MEA3155657.1 hypothetical protein [Betaproteobacteria bacterium]
MRTVVIILGGLVLLAVCVGIARAVGGSRSDDMLTAIIGFIAVWFMIAAANMWVGVTKAGYSFSEELPIFLLIFGVPAAAAILAKWKLL